MNLCLCFMPLAFKLYSLCIYVSFVGLFNFWDDLVACLDLTISHYCLMSDWCSFFKLSPSLNCKHSFFKLSSSFQLQTFLPMCHIKCFQLEFKFSDGWILRNLSTTLVSNLCVFTFCVSMSMWISLKSNLHAPVPCKAIPMLKGLVESEHVGY